MNSNFLISSRGANTDSGIIYRNCGLSQMSKTPVFAGSGLDPIQYENPENEKELLENLNADTQPNFYKGNSENIKQLPEQVYYEVPTEEIGGDTQESYAKKPDVNSGQPPKDPPMTKDIFIPVNKEGKIPIEGRPTYFPNK